MSSIMLVTLQKHDSCARVLYYIKLYYIILYHIISYHIISYHIISSYYSIFYIISYYIILYYSMYYIILYVILYYIIVYYYIANGRAALLCCEGTLVSHCYWSVGVFTVTVTAYNHVDSENASLTVTVQDIIHSQFISSHLFLAQLAELFI